MNSKHIKKSIRKLFFDFALKLDFIIIRNKDKEKLFILIIKIN